MKQVININFQGRVVPIEVTAFEILKEYTESLNRYFAMEEGKEEIINDIESRIGELFQERLKAGSTCITDDDVNAIIKSIGRPEDFETDQATADSANARKESSNQQSDSSTQTTAATPGNKRLYRDENNKILGGVCSGVANYFGIDVVVVRIIFVVLFGAALIPYIILWVAVPSSASTVIGGLRKKLYRDNDDKIIAGVCSGIGNYFGINAWIPRVLFLLPFIGVLGRISHWGDFDFPNFVFSPGSLIVYIILWLVIPEALTTAEKLEMKGEKVDMNSIKNSVVEEMKGVQQRAEKFGKEAKNFAQSTGKTFGTEVGSAARRGSRSLGDVIVLLFKIFVYFILGCIGFGLVVALFAFAGFSIGVFPVKDFILTDGWQNAFAWGTLIFFIAVPIIGILTWLIRRIAKIKTNRKSMRVSFIGLWIIGWFCLIALLTSISRDFRSINTINEQEVALSNPGVSKLEITTSMPDKKYYNNRWFRFEPFENFDEDTAYVRNISIHIVKSANDSFRVTMLKMVNGRNKRSADTLAALMNFNAEQRDSTLLIDKGVAITRKDKFRNQRIIMTVYVPVGKRIMVNRNVGWGYDIHFDGPFHNNGWDVDFGNLEEGWDEDTEYIMTKDSGLVDVITREPADTWKHPSKKKGRVNVTIDNDDDVNMNSNDDYRYDKNSPAGKIDSMQQKLQLEQKRLKDSLEKAKDNIDKQLEKIGGNASTHPSSTMMATIPAYNPLLILN